MPKPVVCLNVVDVESTCWDGPTPEGQCSEIIEIGITQVNLFFPQISHSFQWRVLPQVSEISPFCTQLTGLTREILTETGGYFGDIVRALQQNFDTKDRVWVSWGDYDRKMFERTAQRWSQPYPFGPRHINLKSLFSILYGIREEMGMAQALEYLGMPLLGRHHSAGDDSKNIARILIHLIGTFQSGRQLVDPESLTRFVEESTRNAHFAADP